MKHTDLMRELDARCSHYIFHCLGRPDVEHAAVRLHRVGAIDSLAKVVIRHRSAMDRLAYQHAINALVIFASLHSGMV